MSEKSDKAIIDTSTLEDIAGAIRFKNGETEKYHPSQMPSKIRAIDGDGGYYTAGDGINITENGEISADVIGILYKKPYGSNIVSCNMTFSEVYDLVKTSTISDKIVVIQFMMNDNGETRTTGFAVSVSSSQITFRFERIRVAFPDEVISWVVTHNSSEQIIYDSSSEYAGTREYQHALINTDDNINIEPRNTAKDNIYINPNGPLAKQTNNNTMIGSASGNIATFSDGADDTAMKSCLVAIEPVQSGSGDPSPQNERPISGWTECNLNVVGKNLFDSELLLGASGWQKDSDGVYYGGSVTMYDKYKKESGGFPLKYPFKETTQYTLSFKGRSSGTNQVGTILAFLYSDNTYSTVLITSNSTLQDYTLTSTVGKTVVCIYASYSNSLTSYITDLQLEEGTTATAYTPYNVNEYEIEFKDGTNPLTVYGGILDVVSGVLTVDRAIQDLGKLTYTYYTQGNNPIFYAPITDAKVYSAGANIIAMCENYKPYATSESRTQLATSLSDGEFSYIAGVTNVTIRDDSYTDPTSFKTAMDGVKLVYELATPQSYQLTGVEVATLLGINNVFADTGDINNAEYKRDATIVINSLFARIEALEA